MWRSSGRGLSSATGDVNALELSKRKPSDWLRNLGTYISYFMEHRVYILWEYCPILRSTLAMDLHIYNLGRSTLTIPTYPRSGASYLSALCGKQHACVYNRWTLAFLSSYRISR